MALELSRIQTLLQSQDPQINSIKDLAKILAVSSETLRKSFRRETGISLHRYIITIKVEHAKELLLSTNLLCSDICEAVGFDREDTGARVFKQLVGHTMLEFRHAAASPARGDAKSNLLQAVKNTSTSGEPRIPHNQPAKRRRL